jgi:hypothetical protein
MTSNIKTFNKNIFLIIIFLQSMLWFGCNENLVPESENKLVVNSLFSTDSTLRVMVCNSLNMLDTNNIYTSFNDNVKVSVYENNVFLTELTNKIALWRLSYIDYNYYSNIVPQAGKNYRIEVVSKDYPVVKASCQIPAKVQIHFSDSVRDANKMICKLKFQDPAGEANYYMIQVLYSYYLELEDGSKISIPPTPMYIDSSDPVEKTWLAHGSEKTSFVFSDHNINGLDYELSLIIDSRVFQEYSDSYFDCQSNPPEMKPVKTHKTTLHFKFYSISKEYYLYVKTLNDFYATRTSAFSEPVMVYNNIENGLGIFAGSTYTEDSISSYNTKSYRFDLKKRN